MVSRLLRLSLLAAFLLTTGTTFAQEVPYDQLYPTEEPAPTPEESPFDPIVDGQSGPPPVAPVALKIPVLGVDASIIPVGEEPDGAMGSPTDPDTVAWWSLGPGTGEPANMVVAAHVDWGGRLRVFGLLHTLAPGDQVVIVDEQAREFWYEVVSSQWMAAEGAPVADVFANTGVPELTMITCGGVFDQSTREYLDRLVVKARQI